MKSAAQIAADEVKRRAAVRQAVLDVVCYDPGSDLTVSALRSHIAMYYGTALACGASVAELAGACAEIEGTYPGGKTYLVWYACLVPPSRAAKRRVANQWNEGLPPPELPMIKRNFSANAPGTFEQDSAGLEHIQPPGSLHKSHGIHRAAVDPEVSLVYRDGGAAGKVGSGSTSRLRRFPAYVERLRAYIEKSGAVSAVNREICEHVIEGKSLQWIADELGMTKASVHKRVVNVRKLAGIAGPGSGR